MKGKCLCEKIGFEFVEIADLVFNCHCSRCRISHGADYATQIFAHRDSLRFTSGEEQLSEYESTGGIRCFCSECGSRLMNYGKCGEDYLSVAASCVADSENLKITANCFLSEKVERSRINQEIPGFDALPTSL